jgi:hypothetical protein
MGLLGKIGDTGLLTFTCYHPPFRWTMDVDAPWQRSPHRLQPQLHPERGSACLSFARHLAKEEVPRTLIIHSKQLESNTDCIGMILFN